MHSLPTICPPSVLEAVIRASACLCLVAPTARADTPTGSDHGQPIIDFPSLVAQANRYQLPEPPRDAKLILANAGWTTFAGSSSDDLDPAGYEAAFFLNKTHDGSTLVMTGFTKFIAKSGRKHQPATLPFNPTPTKRKLGGYFFGGYSLNSFATAIQCARRGDLKTARALADLYLKSKYHSGFNKLEGSQQYNNNLPLLLARATFEFHYRDVRRTDANLQQALDSLEKLQAEFPQLFSEDPDRFFRHDRSRFVADLRLTVKSPKPKKDSIEDILTQLAKGDHLPYDWERSALAYRIYNQGTAAIPELVRLSTCRKLTPAINHGFNNAPESRIRIGQISAGFLDNMTGAHSPTGSGHYRYLDDTWKEWLRRTDLTDEKQFLLTALSETTGNGSDDDEIPLTILLHRYPETASQLAKQVSGDQRSSFIAVIMDSSLDNKRKTECLAAAYSRESGLGRRYMLRWLAELDPKSTAKELIPLIKSLPNDVSTPYSTAPESKLSYVVARLDDPAVWRDYLAKTKTSSIGLRMEMIKTMVRVRTGENTWNLRLAYLAAFLNDTEIRTVDPFDKRWDGAHAGSAHDTLSVQNFVAEGLASLLKLPGEPADYWTEKQWGPFRQNVEHAISKLDLPDL